MTRAQALWHPTRSLTTWLCVVLAAEAVLSLASLGQGTSRSLDGIASGFDALLNGQSKLAEARFEHASDGANRSSREEPISRASPQAYLNGIALRLNQRPRKTLAFETPANRLQLVLRRSIEITPENGQTADVAAGPHRANRRHGVVLRVVPHIDVHQGQAEPGKAEKLHSRQFPPKDAVL